MVYIQMWISQAVILRFQILMFAQTSNKAVMFHQVEKAHDADLHCVDWNPFDENFILTGQVVFLPFETDLVSILCCKAWFDMYTI